MIRSTFVEENVDETRHHHIKKQEEKNETTNNMEFIPIFIFCLRFSTLFSTPFLFLPIYFNKKRALKKPTFNSIISHIEPTF